jgi:hypothetical protein
VFAELTATGWALDLESVLDGTGDKAPPISKVKFSCPGCGANAWGKPDLHVTCTDCGVPMPPA